MKIKSLKANQTQITLPNGTIVFVSYKTPVAAFIVGKGIIRTSKKWSVTTTKHINAWIREEFSPYVSVEEVEQRELDTILS